MKQSIILWVAFTQLFAAGSGTLLAQKGLGRMGGPGPGATLPPTTGKSRASSRETAPSSGAASARTMSSTSTSVSARLTNDTALSTRIQPLLPAGSTVAAASAGFRNQGEFIAALHVSRNLNIPFDQLKAKLTGNNAESMGQAIHDLRPELSRSAVKRDVHTADRQADQDVDAARLANRLSTNATLAARAQALLPAGTNLQGAAAGFNDVRQFLLVEHVARDLNIPFAQLKAQVTGANSLSLKQAISAARPDLSSAAIQADLKSARQQTQTDLQAAGEFAGDQREIARAH
jgi:hypothetical protein